jgi:hypothetical protein
MCMPESLDQWPFIRPFYFGEVDMSNIETGGPAFPILAEQAEDGWASVGMTMRDYFAATAVHQFLRGAVIPNGYDAKPDFLAVAKRSYEVADAMLEARK